MRIKLFFRVLLKAHGITGIRVEDAGSNSKIHSRLSASKLYENLRHILIVADNDDTIGPNFQLMRSQIVKAFPERVAPEAPRETAESPTGPSIAILIP